MAKRLMVGAEEYVMTMDFPGDRVMIRSVPILCELRVTSEIVPPTRCTSIILASVLVNVYGLAPGVVFPMWSPSDDENGLRSMNTFSGLLSVPVTNLRRGIL